MTADVRVPVSATPSRDYGREFYVLTFTSPCPYCGGRHTHGSGIRPLDADGPYKGTWGPRVPHCGPHSHQRTATGRRRNPFAKGALCRESHPDYILVPAEGVR